MKIKLLLILICSFTTLFAMAQPANNVCSGAITLPQDGSCVTGTTVAATDNWVGTVGCAGNNAEVWYTFVATGTQMNLVITSGTMGGNIELTIVSATGLCSGLGIAGSNCGPSVLNSTFNGVQVGVRYYVTISSTGANGTFTVCNTVTSPPPVPGQDCTASATLCNSSSFSQGTFSGVGTVENISTNSCFGANERQSKWYKFTLGCAGTIAFDIIPAVATNDYDFALWNTTAGCYSTATTMGAPMACNWSGTSGPTGITSTGNQGDVTPNPCTSVGAADCTAGNGPGGSGCQSCTYVNTLINGVAGQTYSMLIDNFGASGSGFSFNFTGSAIIGPSAAFTSSLNASCLTLSVAKTCATANSTYLWSYGDGTTSTLQNPPAKTYAAAGNYTVSLTVTDALGCTRTVSQTVNVGCMPLPVELSSLNGERSERYMDLSWDMASELNNDYFTLERSLDGKTWEHVAQVKSIGDYTNGYIYEHRDDISKISMTKTVYYRLFQTDINGEMKNLGTVVASGVIGYDREINISVAPNPSDEKDVQVLFENLNDEEGVLMVTDLNGHVVKSNDVKLSKGVTTLLLSTENWNQGVYIISFVTSTTQERTRFIKL